MAVDVYYSDNFVGMISPRLSFSRDLDENNESTLNPINDYSCRIDSTFDFAFNVDTTVAFASSSADELFSDGKIIPACIKYDEVKDSKVAQQKSVMPCLDLPSTTVTEERKKSLKEFLEDSLEEEEEPNNASASASASASETENATAAATSFWQFRRSNSLNCDRNQRKGLIGSWKILSRSGSTGKFLEKIVEEEEKPNTNFHTKLLKKFSRNNSLNNSENLTTSCNVSNKGLTGSSSSKILRRSHSTSDKYFAKSDSKHFRRSNSTGSAPNTNKLKKQQSQKQQQNHQLPTQKGKVKDGFRGYYGSNNNYNSLKINPVLNLPSPYISRVSLDLFSFGSLFCNGTKDRKKRK